ncbi:MAG: N-6 DNA methylase [Rickettsiales bacterium]|nr:N-6 DNA methylase [Rickettsiales bacterium]
MTEYLKLINQARDCLVGKVPSPQEQVNQIMIALIYKFMYIMDEKSAKLGGKKEYFIDEYEQYSWRDLMSPQYENQQKYNLYTEGIEKFKIHKNLIDTFRQVFKEAYVPYKDPTTLISFLKIIDKFDYSNSEVLGSAFEQFLNIMGTQSDSGQFRTPRHIIDFIVNVVNPIKTDTILDPACGTAGFLISAFSYIEKQKPTLQEKQNFTNNFAGYDITPIMATISMVNLYLHGFKKPKIYEYDTLTSTEHWKDRFDVILANPPFMTPKGAVIKPNTNFTLKTKRTEVLFSEYILEHLKSEGRAGFIIPDGVVFRSDKAYLELRKMLVENGLYAVVKLPNGVFQPYTQIGTNIFFIDKRLKGKSVLFVEVENDGYDFGSNRNPINKNDLPEVIKILDDFKSKDELVIENYKVKALIVKKEEILNRKDRILQRKSYETKEKIDDGKYEMVSLSDILDFKGKGKRPASFVNGDGKYNFYKSSKHLEIFKCDTADLNGEYLMLGKDACASVYYENGKFSAADSIVLYQVKNDRIHTKYVYQYLKQNIQTLLCPFFKGATILHARPSDFETIQIPLPPIEIQKEITAEIDNITAEIDNITAIINNKEREKTHFKSLIREVKFTLTPEELEKMEVSLSDCCDILNGATPLKCNENYWNKCEIPWLSVKDIKDNERIIMRTEKYITKQALKETSCKLIPINSILISCTATIGEYALTKIELTTNQQINALIVNDKYKSKIEPKYLFYCAMLWKDKLLDLGGKTTIDFVSTKLLGSIKIFLPPFEKQKEIVTKMEVIENLNKQLKVTAAELKNRIDNYFKCFDVI